MNYFNYVPAPRRAFASLYGVSVRIGESKRDVRHAVESTYGLPRYAVQRIDSNGVSRVGSDRRIVRALDIN